MGAPKREYTQQFKDEVVDYYQNHTVKDTEIKFKIANRTIYDFLLEMGLEQWGYKIDKRHKFGLSDGMSRRERTYDFSKKCFTNEEY